MEKAIIIMIVCVAIVLLILHLKKSLKGDGSCSGCGSSEDCNDKGCC